jgi:putrescine transport system permease protein
VSGTPSAPLRADPAQRWQSFWSGWYRLGPPRWAEMLKGSGLGKALVIGIPFGWLLLFFLAPFLIDLKISFAQIRLGLPPYTPLLEWTQEQSLRLNMNWGNYAFLFSDALYLNTYLYSLKVAFISTVLCLLLGYPMAYGIARAAPARRNLLLMLVILPFWTSFLLRVYAWIGLLRNNGVINNLLMAAGVIDEPIQMLQTDYSIYIGIVYSYLPFMILPLYTNLEKHDGTLLEAAADLGARPARAFWKVTLPLSMPGVWAGCLLVFIPVIGEYVIPALMGRPDQLMIGRVLSDEFFNNRDWPVASAVATLMLLALVLPIMLFRRLQERQLEGESR